MKFIYEHDEEEDFIEVQLTEKELYRLILEEPIECSVPACLHTRRLTNVYIRKMKDAINQEQKQESDREEYRGRGSGRQAKEAGCGHSAKRSPRGRSEDTKKG
jgi:hypothetical protein